MALNPPVAREKGGTLVPVPQVGETLHLRRDGVEFQCKLQGKCYLKGKGTVVLSSHRIVFICESKSGRPEFEAFEVILERLGKHKFKQPVFGLTSLVGDVQSSLASTSSTLRSCTISLKFTTGSCGTLMQLFRKIMDQVQRLPNAVAGESHEDALDHIKSNAGDPNDPSILYLEQPTLEMNDDVRGHVSAGYLRARELEEIIERFRTRCASEEEGARRTAWELAVQNLHQACPPAESAKIERSLADFHMRQRRAWLMSSALEKVMSSSFLHVLQVLHICLGALGELLGSCLGSLQQLTAMHGSLPEFSMAIESDEFQNFLRGLGSLRRLIWRFSLLAELLLPRGTPDTLEPCARSIDGARLEHLLSDASLCFAGVKASWAQIEFELIGLGLDRSLGRWDPGSFFEVDGSNGTASSSNGHSPTEVLTNGHKKNGTNGEIHKASRLCSLCLLPARPPRQPPPPHGPMVFLMPGDLAAASAQWRGRFWHVQCVNFWKEHGMNFGARRDQDMPDPFPDPAIEESQ